MKFTVTRTIRAQQKLSRALLAAGKTIAVVPTMGSLHEGHLSLIRRALKAADIVVTTIFVNPTQFAPDEDFDRYPRDIRGDLRKIRKVGGQIVFIPRSRDIYPDDYETYVTVEHLTETLEGWWRPTHFRGVTTVVAKLFNIVSPDVAVFGMKDYQQAMVLKRMTADLNWPIRFIIAPTVRERDGLAMSSRNRYLSPDQRRQATALYQSLIAARKMVRDGITGTAPVEKMMRRLIRRIAPDGKIDYIAFTRRESLRPLAVISRGTIASLAVRLGPVRLIDNMKVA